MTVLQFWPRQSHHLLVSAGETIHAGETFEVPDDEVDGLLENEEIRRPAEAGSAGNPVAAVVDAGAGDGNDASQTQSPVRAERSPIT